MANVKPVAKDIFDLLNDPSVNFTDTQMTSMIDSFAENKVIGKLNLILSRISHQQLFLENNEAVIKGRAVLAFHKRDFTLVIHFVILILINSFRIKILCTKDLINTLI